MGNFWRDLRRAFFNFVNYNKDKAATHKSEEVGKNAGNAESRVNKPQKTQFRKRENVSSTIGEKPAARKKSFKPQSKREEVKKENTREERKKSDRRKKYRK